MPSNSQYRPLTKPKPRGASGSTASSSAAAAAVSLLTTPSSQVQGHSLVLSANQILVVVSAAFVVLSLLCSFGTASVSPSAAAQGGAGASGGRNRAAINVPCDPLRGAAMKGYVTLQPGSSGLATYKTFDSRCPSGNLLPGLLSSLPSSPFHSTVPNLSQMSADAKSTGAWHKGYDIAPSSYISNRTVLVIGDDVDRTLVRQFCRLAGKVEVNVDAKHPWGEPLGRIPKDHRPDPSKATSEAASLALYCYVEEFDFLVAAVSHYGLSTSVPPTSQEQTNLPIPYEERLSDLFAPLVRSMRSPLAHEKAPELPPARPTSAPELVIVSTTVSDALSLAGLLNLSPNEAAGSSSNAAGSPTSDAAGAGAAGSVPSTGGATKPPTQAEAKLHLEKFRKGYAEILRKTMGVWKAEEGAKRGGEGRRIRWRGLAELAGSEKVVAPLLLSTLESTLQSLLPVAPSSGSSAPPSSNGASKQLLSSARLSAPETVGKVHPFAFAEWAKGTPSLAVDAPDEAARSGLDATTKALAPTLKVGAALWAEAMLWELVGI